jgi:FKBP-type peptidyl-prolyl cis-trans isomerase 2
MRTLLLAALAFFCAGGAFAEDSGRQAEAGDLVKVHYTAASEDGKVFYTTRQELVDDPELDKADWFKAPRESGPELVVAGEKAFFPGVGERVLGMEPGESRDVLLPPGGAFGYADPKLVQHFDKVLSIPRSLDMSPVEFVGRFKAFPVLNGEYELNPQVRFKVVEFDKEAAAIEVLADDGATYQGPYGETTIRVTEDQVQLRLKPEVGAKVQGVPPGAQSARQGRITSQNATHFTIDYNPVVAGQSVALNLEVVEILKASEFEGSPIEWSEPESGEQALESFSRSGKPVVAVLHTERCGWCKRLFDQTMTDVRIKSLRDDFVWVKVDVEKHPEYKEKYDLSGTPLTVVLDERGEVVERVEGFSQAPMMYKTLTDLL